MPRPKGGQRAIGPYHYPERPRPWRIVAIGADGRRGSFEFGEEQDAVTFRDRYNKTAVSKKHTLQEALERYEHHFLVVKGNKPASWPETKRRVLRLAGPSDTRLISISPSKASERYSALASEVSVDTHRGCLVHVKTFFTWAVAEGLCDANPFTSVVGTGRKKKGKTKLTTDEARRFRDEALRLLSETTNRVLFERYLMGLIALYLGARASEITSRQVRDIDENCTIYRIPDSKTPSGRRKERIPAELAPFFATLVKGRAGTDPLFPGRYHKSNKTHDHRYVTRYCVKPLCAALGLPPVTAHGLRGTFADLAVEEGLAPLTVARNLGQADDRVTREHYISAQTLSYARARAAQSRLAGTTNNINTSEQSLTAFPAKEMVPTEPK